MTCAVAVRDPKRGCVVVGADSCGGRSDGDWTVHTLRNQKVFRNGPFVIGYTSSFRMGQLLQHSFKAPVPPKRGDLLGFMVRDFVEAARAVLKQGGYTRIENNAEEAGEFVCAIGRRIFVIESNLQIIESTEPFAAVGCGSSFALGALRALPQTTPAKSRCLAALKVGERSSGGVVRPFHFVSTEP